MERELAKGQSKRVVKLFVTADEADRIRLAAALRRQSIGEFARDVVLQETQRLTAKIELPPETTSKKRS